MRIPRKISLDWNEETANVIEHVNGQTFEIGTVVLDTLLASIVGCTYYHHLLAKLEPDEEQSFAAYEANARKHQRDLRRLKERLQRLHADHPELTLEQLALNDSDFIDLAIPIRFSVPFLPSDPYPQTILEKITPYIDLLGTNHDLEIMKRV